MSLNKMLAANDDAALTAQASKGLVRRAQRDFEAGKVETLEVGAKTAKLKVDGHSVQIDAAGLAQSSCTCPASGICRHLLSAMIALREAQPADTAQDAAPAGPSAQEEVVKLSEAAIRKFAGADWPAARSLAAEIAGRAEISAEQSSLNVVFPDEKTPVVFLAGQGLKGAVFKGSERRRRALVAAAALVTRAQNGAAIPEADPEAEAEGPQLSAKVVLAAAQAVENSLGAVLSGSADLAKDALLDAAISARADAAPRLTAHLRGLAQLAQEAQTRSIQYRPDVFLRRAAQTYALAQALIKTPDDPALTGVIKRDFTLVEPMDLWVIGAADWQTPSGARGFRIHLFAPEQKRWLGAGEARASAADPNFYPRSVYTTPLLGGPSAQNCMGAVLHAAGARMSADGHLASTVEKASTPTQTPFTLDGLAEAGAIHEVWAQARRDLSARAGAGLRRSAIPHPMLLAPSQLGEVRADEISQLILLDLFDVHGDRLTVKFEPGHQSLAHRLQSLSQMQALLVEATLNVDGVEEVSLNLRPITALWMEKDALKLWNILLDPAPKGPKGLKGAFEKLRKTFSAAPPPIGPRDPILHFADAVLTAATDAAAGKIAPDLPQLARKADRLGLSSLSASIDRLAEAPNAANAMRAAYLAAEVECAAQV